MSYIGNTSTTQAFTPAVDFFNGNGSTTAFTLSRPVASVAQVQAVISNVPQKPGDAFTVSGNTITFTSAPPSGTQNIYVYYTSPITQVIAPGQNTVTTTALQDGSVTPVKLSTGAPSWDTSGNIGIGVTPSAWQTSSLSRAIQFNAASIYSYQSTNTLISQNGYYDGTWKYYNTGPTGRLNLYQDQLNFDAAASGTQNTAISYTNILSVARGSTLALQSATQSNGTGIAFPSTAAPSGNANTLDDYEEGTWFPTLSFGGTAATISASYGFYVKVGRQVTLTGYFTISSKNGGSGDAVLGGFPFPIGNSSNHYPGGSLGYYNNFTLPTGTTGLSWYGLINTSSIYPGYNSTTGWSVVQASHAASNAQFGPYTICYISD
jgi:hypothetical protein